MSFAEKLEQEIIYAGMSKAKAARMFDIGPAHLSHILSGKTKPGLELIQRICRALKIEPNQLIEVDDI